MQRRGRDEAWKDNSNTQGLIASKRLLETSGEATGAWFVRDGNESNFNTEAYSRITDNPFLASADDVVGDVEDVDLDALDVGPLEVVILFQFDRRLPGRRSSGL